MIAVLVSWELESPMYREALVEKFQRRRLLYDGMAGLRSKTYWIDWERGEYGGFYLWETREAAEALYTPEWIEQATAFYGSRPEIRFLEVPVYVDNVVPEPVSYDL